MWTRLISCIADVINFIACRRCGETYYIERGGELLPGAGRCCGAVRCGPVLRAAMVPNEYQHKATTSNRQAGRQS